MDIKGKMFVLRTEPSPLQQKNLYKTLPYTISRYPVPNTTWWQRWDYSQQSSESETPR